MNWIILIVAGLCEVGFTYCLGRAKGVTGMEWWTWIVAFVLLYVLSAVLLAKATQTIPLGTAYPVWTGIGAVGAGAVVNKDVEPNTVGGIPAKLIKRLC